MKIRKVIAIAVLAGCGVVDLVSNGLSYSKAVETDLEHTTGMKPEVGFNWHNGSFETVTVTFPQLYGGKPIEELARTVREFKQAPGTIVLAFTLKG